MMTRDELFALHAMTSAKALEVMKRKNSDYANGADPFRNFRRHGAHGVLVRLSDKLARLESYEEKGSFAVADEGLEDTDIDIINYAIIHLGMKTETP